MNEVGERTISAVGIPTCDRPECLRRCVSSLVEHLRRAGREIELFVVDDSRGVDMQAVNQGVLRELSSSFAGTIHYVDRPARARMAAELAARLGISEDILRFALLGDDDIGPSYGAARNTLLLLTAGRMFVMADDDTLFCVAESPGKRTGLAFTSRHDANEYWYFASEREAMDAVTFEEHDLFALHERLLGKRLEEVASDGEDIDIAGVDASFAARLHLPGARVGVTYLGTAGDSGMSGHAFRMLEEGTSLDRMLASETAFELGMTTRWVVKLAPRASVSSGSFCMALHIGLDNRQPLPPFIPVMRNEDGVFGSVLATSFPEVLSGYQPAVVPHLPPTTRTAISLSDATRINTVRVNDLISQLITVAVASHGYRHSLEAVGDYLSILGALPEGVFMQKVLETAERQARASCAFALQRFDSLQRKPSFLGKAIHSYVQSLERINPGGGADLCGDWVGEPSLRFETLRGVTERFGALLLHWHTIVESSLYFGSPRTMRIS